MRIALAADHAGFALKERIKIELAAGGVAVIDLGADSDAPVDYPDYAERVGAAISRGEVDRAVIVCGSGVGVSVAANKHPGVRAGLCHDHYSAHQGVEHDDMNVLCLGARVVGPSLALELVETFLSAKLSPEERHRRRIAKVRAIEARYLRTP